MKNLLKVLFSLLVGLIVVSPALAYPDVSSNHWAAKQIEILTEKGVIVGYPDGTFKPDDNVTRAEFASMAIKALGQELLLHSLLILLTSTRHFGLMMQYKKLYTLI